MCLHLPSRSTSCQRVRPLPPHPLMSCFYPSDLPHDVSNTVEGGVSLLESIFNGGCGKTEPTQGLSCSYKVLLLRIVIKKRQQYSTLMQGCLVNGTVVILLRCMTAAVQHSHGNVSLVAMGFV